MRPRSFATASVIALACCAPQADIPVASTRAKLAGLSPSQVQACMGTPSKVLERGGALLYTYASPSAQLSPVADPSSSNFDYSPFAGDPQMPGLGLSAGPVARAGCLVNVVFDGARVRTVTYVAAGGNLVPQGPECTQVVARCVR
jgi:hypothetical protein